MSRRTKRRKPMAEINVVPYIDVTLVLLIIFMITTPMLQTGVDVDLPEAESKAIEQKQEGSGKPIPPIVLSIEANMQYHLSTDGQPDNSIQPDEINERVQAALVRNENAQVLIKADKSIEYGKVVEVMASLKNVGIANVGLMTEPSDK